MGPDAFGRPPMTSLVNVSLGVAALSHQSFYAIPPASGACLAYDGERRPARVGQHRRAVAGHEVSRGIDRSFSAIDCDCRCRRPWKQMKQSPKSA